MDEADGLIYLYSISLQGRPEMTLTCQYEVTKAMFNPFDPNVIIGATQTGYLLEWDVRAKKEPISGIEDRRNRSQPIQKSCLAQNGHTYPIYSLAVVGSQSAHNIVSISNDGKMCLWKPKVLADPKDHYYLEINPNMAGPSRTSTNIGNSILQKSADLSAMAASQSA
jgi:dynein intermediate chain